LEVWNVLHLLSKEVREASSNSATRIGVLSACTGVVPAIGAIWGLVELGHKLLLTHTEIEQWIDDVADSLRHPDAFPKHGVLSLEIPNDHGGGLRLAFAIITGKIVQHYFNQP